MKNRKLYIVLIIIAVGISCAIFASTQDKQTTDQKTVKMTRYIERFNQVNPSDAIDENTVQNYYHHGRTHDGQLIFDKSGFEIVISNTHDDNFETVIKGERQKTNDDYKNIFADFSKVYSSTLSEQAINDYWARLIDDNTHSVTFDEFDCRLSEFNDRIEMITINGTVQ